MSTYCNHYKKDNCDCYDKKKHDHCDHDRKKDCRAIFKCGREINRSLPTSVFDALAPGTKVKPIPLAEVTIDTRKLCTPCVRIEYSSTINYTITNLDTIEKDIDLNLTFRLVRKCRGEDEEPLRTWQYQRLIYNVGAGNTVITFKEPFTVTFCDCFERPCCDEKYYTYTLQLVQALGTSTIGTTLDSTYGISEKDIIAQATCTSCVY